MATPPRMGFDAALRAAFAQSPHTLRSLAAAAGVEMSSLSRWLRGVHGLSLATADKIAEVLDVSASVPPLTPLQQMLPFPPEKRGFKRRRRPPESRGTPEVLPADAVYDDDVDFFFPWMKTDTPKGDRG